MNSPTQKQTAAEILSGLVRAGARGSDGLEAPLCHSESLLLCLLNCKMGIIALTPQDGAYKAISPALAHHTYSKYESKVMTVEDRDWPREIPPELANRSEAEAVCRVYGFPEHAV